MAKQKLVMPADALKGFMDEYQVNVAVLAQDIQLSGSTVRQLLNGKMRISLSVAGRLARYFGTTIQFWTDMQGAIDFADFKNNKELQKEISGISKAKKPKASSKAAPKPPRASAAKADKEEASPRTSRRAKAAEAAVKTTGRRASKADKEAPQAPKTRKRRAVSKPAPQEEEEFTPVKPKTILIKKTASIPVPEEPQEEPLWTWDETPPVHLEEQTPEALPEDPDTPDFSED
jgi:addiction module HigA family antidote